jgi:hypothetical protein
MALLLSESIEEEVPLADIPAVIVEIDCPVIMVSPAEDVFVV